MKWSSSIRKWSRLIHRDLSFFFAGMVLIYAISGIVMNHRDTINPNFSIERKEYKIAEKLPGKEGMKRENVLTLLQPLGEEGNYTKHYFPKADIMKVFLKGGSNLQVNVRTGEAVYESVTRRPLIGAMARLHYNPGQWWTYFADIFAVGLIIITLSGVIIVRALSVRLYPWLQRLLRFVRLQNVTYRPCNHLMKSAMLPKRRIAGIAWQ